MPENFFLQDVLGVSAAALLFPLFLIPPGYALGWLLNLVSFRTQPPQIRLLLSLPLTIVLTPVLFYLLGRVSLGWPIWALFGVSLAATVPLFQPVRIPKPAWAIGGFWFTLATLSLVDMQFGRRVYYPVIAYDYTLRSAIVGAISRASSLPPANPFFYPGHSEPFRYHYFWALICSLPSRLAHIDPRHSTIAATIWAGFALMALVLLYLRFFLNDQSSPRWSIALLFICGLDIFPVLVFDVVSFTTHQLDFLPSVDWWNNDQIASWLDTMLWVPHNVAAIVACLAGFLILHHETRVRWQSIVAAGLAFASAAGLSIYLTLVFAIFLLVWTIICFVKKEPIRGVSLMGTGVVAAVLAAPFLVELLSIEGNGAPPVVPGIRMFSPFYILNSMLSRHPSPFLPLASFAALPLDYFLELGVLFVIGAAWYRKRGMSSAPDSIMVIATLFVCTFFKSNSGTAINDLGARGMLIAQFVLLLWGASLLPDLLQSPRWRTLTRATILFGVVTSIYELTILRVYPVLIDAGILPTLKYLTDYRDLGERTFSLRTIYRQLDRATPPSAVVQHNPMGLQDIFAGLYSNRQMAIMSFRSARTFAGQEEAARSIETPLEDLFAGKRSDADALCRELSIGYLVAKDVDAVWKDPNSWLWQRPVISRSDRAVAVTCGASGMP